MDSLSHFAVGAQAYNFEFVDPEGKMVKLSDFGVNLYLLIFGLLVGSCRYEMKYLRPIYDELKGDDLVFISISLDRREKRLEEKCLRKKNYLGSCCGTRKDLHLETNLT